MHFAWLATAHSSARVPHLRVTPHTSHTLSYLLTIIIDIPERSYGLAVAEASARPSSRRGQQEREADADPASRGASLYLKTSGQLFDKLAVPTKGGIITSIWNYPARGGLWRLKAAAFNPRTGNFSLADERGQIFACSIENSSYHNVRMASTAISALSYVHGTKTSRANELIVGYENGVVIAVDTRTREIVGNYHAPKRSTVRIIRTHPGKLIVIMAMDDRSICMFDLR